MASSGSDVALLSDCHAEVLCGGRMLPGNLALQFPKVTNTVHGVRHVGTRLAALLLEMASIVRNTSFLFSFGNIVTAATWSLLSPLFLCIMKREETGFTRARRAQLWPDKSIKPR